MRWNGPLRGAALAAVLLLTSCGPASVEDRGEARPSPSEDRPADPLDGVEGLVEVTGDSLYVIDPESGQATASFGFREAAGHECASQVTSLSVRDNLEHLSWGSLSGFCIAHLDSGSGTYVIGHVFEADSGDYYGDQAKLSNAYFHEETESFWYGVDARDDGEVEVFSLPLDGGDYGEPVAQTVLTDAGHGWWIDDEGEPRATEQVKRQFDGGEATHTWDGTTHRPTLLDLKELHDGRVVENGVFRSVTDIGDDEYLALLDLPKTPVGDIGQIVSFHVSDDGEIVDLVNVIEPTDRIISHLLWDSRERRVLFRDGREGFHQVKLDGGDPPVPMPQLDELAERHRESERTTSESAHRLIGFHHR